MVYWESRAAFGANGIISHLDGHLLSKKRNGKRDLCIGCQGLELGLALGTSRPRFIHLYSMMDKWKEELSSSGVFFKFLSRLFLWEREGAMGISLPMLVLPNPNIPGFLGKLGKVRTGSHELQFLLFTLQDLPGKPKAPNEALSMDKLGLFHPLRRIPHFPVLCGCPNGETPPMGGRGKGI